MSRPDFIETFTGKRFRPLAPVVADIDIRDIAHALSQQCRFSGHTRTPYSVAQHCVLVSYLLEDMGLSPWLQLAGLLHDASEAYLVDIPSPLKSTAMFSAYRDAEEALMEAVRERFRLSLCLFETGEVAWADAKLLATEARDLMPYRPEHWAGLEASPLPKKIIPWGPYTAKDQFLARFEELTHV